MCCTQVMYLVEILWSHGNGFYYWLFVYRIEEDRLKEQRDDRKTLVLNNC